MRTAAKARAHVFMRKAYLIEGLKSTSGRLRDDGRLWERATDLKSPSHHQTGKLIKWDEADSDCRASERGLIAKLL
jgi:hypothetical protein